MTRCKLVCKRGKVTLKTTVHVSSSRLAGATSRKRKGRKRKGRKGCKFGRSKSTHRCKKRRGHKLSPYQKAERKYYRKEKVRRRHRSLTPTWE